MSGATTHPNGPGPVADAPLLVIAHEATRTGSPRVLLELLRHAVPRMPVPVAVRSVTGGPLLAELNAVATSRGPVVDPCAVLVNGSLAAAELLAVSPTCATAVYVHEEGEALRVLPGDAVRALRERADRVVCVSEGSRRGLVELGVDPARISVLPPVVVAAVVPDAARSHARSLLGGARGRVVLGCGEAGWRKGADLFVQTARHLARDARTPDEEVRFAWVGRQVRSFQRVLDHDVAALGLSGRVTFVDEVDDPSALLAAADLLLMTSREDPQPLVPLEAALVGTPTVGFAVGGLSDLAAVGAAAVAPFPDVAALADLAGGVLDDAATADGLVAAAAGLTTRTRAIDVVGPAFADVLRSLLTAGEARA